MDKVRLGNELRKIQAFCIDVMTETIPPLDDPDTLLSYIQAMEALNTENATEHFGVVLEGLRSLKSISETYASAMKVGDSVTANDAVERGRSECEALSGAVETFGEIACGWTVI